MDESFDEYHITLLNGLDHPVVTEEWKRNLDAAVYEKKTNM